MASPGTGRATPPAPAVPPSSALLQCLSQLDVDAWASVLLPKLVADGSAGSLAATCSQLRALCQSCVQRLDLQQLASPDNPAGRIQQWTQHLGQRFPNCTCVDLLLGKAIHSEAPSVLGALARLPKLVHVLIEADDTCKLDTKGMATLLSLLHSQLPRLRSLVLDFGNSCKGRYVPRSVWQQLGCATQLTMLELWFGDQDTDPFDAPGLSELSRLTGLRSLLLRSTPDSDDFDVPDKPRRWGFLPHLTALNALNIFMSHPDDLARLGSCTSLVSLEVNAAAYSAVQQQLEPATWAAVGQLTRLTELRLLVVDHYEDAPTGFEPAIKQLTRLEVFACHAWTSEVLPALQGLPALRHVLGEWRSVAGLRPHAAVKGVTLPQVRTLSAAGMDVDFQVFPGLETFGQRCAVLAASFGSLAACCPHLRDWWVERVGDFDPNYSIWTTEPLHSRATVLQSLTALQRLTRLDFVSVCDAEVLTLAATAEHLVRRGSLQQLRVVVSDLPHPRDKDYHGCCFSSLTHFARLSGLRKLQIELRHSNSVCASGWEAVALLSAFRGFAGSVSIAGRAHQLSCFEEGQRLLVANGLGVSWVQLIPLRERPVIVSSSDTDSL